MNHKNGRADIEDLLEMDIPTMNRTNLRTTKQEMFSHNYSFDEDIGEPSKYRDLINALYMSGENDDFNFLINSCGGRLSSALAIIEAIRASQATVRGIITGECHSAASMIALNCDEVFVTDSAHMMIHTASYGTGGSTGNVKMHTDFSTDFINKFLDKTYSGFLSKDELEDVKKGVDLWFDAAQIRKRLIARAEYHAELQVKKEAKKKPKTKPTESQAE